MSKFRVGTTTDWSGRMVYTIEQRIYKGLFGEDVYCKYMPGGMMLTYQFKTCAQMECDRLNRAGESFSYSNPFKGLY